MNLTYPADVAICSGEKLGYTLHIANPTDSQISIKLNLSVPEEFYTDFKYTEFSLSAGEERSISFSIYTDTISKLAINDMDIKLCANGLDLRVYAPIIIGIPWVNAKTNEIEFSRGFIKNIPSGEQEYRVKFKVPNKGMHAVACTASRDVEVYINGNLIIKGDTSGVKESIHRGSARAVKLFNDYTEAIIKISNNKDERNGKFFFGVGNLDSWIWDECVEWKPFYNSDSNK